MSDHKTPTTFKDFIPPMGTHRLYGMGPQDFLDTMPERRWTRRAAEIAEITPENFKGITTDGTVMRDVFSIRSEGAPTLSVVEAAGKMLGLLNDAQRAKVVQPVTSMQKNRWQNGIPDYEKEGIRLDEVRPPVRDAVMAILRAAMGAEGYARLRDVMRLNGYLGELVGAEKLLGEWCYRIHFWGTPSTSEPWGWQFAGHHLAMTCFMLGDQMVHTPIFFGVEPNEASEGQFAGASVFKDEEAAGLRFAQGLDADQRRKAVIYDSILPGDLPPGRHHPLNGLNLGNAYCDNVVVPYEGITGADLRPDQKQGLLDLARSYLRTLPQGPLSAKMEDLERHWAETRFCWAGGLEEDSVFYYRIQSPVVMIEFDHHQGVVLNNEAPERFHIHTLVRTPNGNDYGADLLRQHYETSAHHNPQVAQAQDHAHSHSPAKEHSHQNTHAQDHHHGDGQLHHHHK
ncbi:hypothetical protein AQS8620_00635 [Aquimixticola soesokkakensis]|uniref:DUF3500 domain-containing protein n=1 Tax=Aquimixticola soesokkakensis TaxID=1519096 RepID=A0A1Y5RQL0_9RHOB|nr:DUF3500 domain-containing protein [Aquimixticola soesokkakensis]SLN22906.1 hypothetical protein AQS8620_00635 [Aquimixticola soesokkakensis]